jgi:hypothetical protein
MSWARTVLDTQSRAIAATNSFISAPQCALALRNGRGGALAEEFGSVTRRFPRSIIALEALSPMVVIHTRWIVMVPGR